MNELKKCPHCGKEFNKYGLKGHIWKNHTQQGLDFYLKYKKKILPKKLQEEIHINRSNARKKWLSENIDKHPWKKNDKFKSYPCEVLKAELIKNSINFIEEFSVFNYSIDIYIPHLNLGLEVNGNQHYDKDKNLTEYYQNRHNKIEEIGIKLIEIHYTHCFNNKLFEIIDFINKYSINKVLDLSNFYTKKDKIIKSKKISDFELKRLNLIEERKSLILNSGIDFSKFGWVGKVSEITKINSQGVNKFMKKYLLEFYTNNCFKRK